MEAIGLVYNTSIQVVICVEHGYCLSSARVRRHLQELHTTKGSALKAACEEVAGLELADLSTLKIPSGRPPIPYLTIDSGFQCIATACNLDKRSINKNRTTVEKYLSEVHNIGRRPGKTLLQNTDIRQVCIQSLLPRYQYRPFIVQGSLGLDKPLEKAQRDTSHITVGEAYPIADMQALSSLLEDQYSSSQQDWKQIYDHLPLPDTQENDLGALWLNRTGISRWVAGFKMDKKELREYIEPLVYSNRSSFPIYIAFY